MTSKLFENVGIVRTLPESDLQVIWLAMQFVAKCHEIHAEFGGSTNSQVSLVAKFASIQAVNSLLMSSGLLCDLGNPPEPITGAIDQSGNMIYRCFHSPSHKWDLAGNLLP